MNIRIIGFENNTYNLVVRDLIATYLKMSFWISFIGLYQIYKWAKPIIAWVKPIVLGV